jgi:hypothetical protein
MNNETRFKGRRRQHGEPLRFPSVTEGNAMTLVLIAVTLGGWIIGRAICRLGGLA